jgi:hypothetical protein
VSGGERRGAQRWTPGIHDLVRVRVRAGTEATVLNCSMAGACLTTTMRLPPGRRCILTWPAVHGVPSVAGAVVRSMVGKLDAKHGALYHVGIKFDAPARFLWELDSQRG